jgi:hypothetical protein
VTPAESAAHWEALATEAEAFGAYEESRGSSGAAWRAKVATYRDCAASLRAEAATGEPHCMCCKPARPVSRCAFRRGKP